jgi:3-phenylpropionate/cinnamic acid dioxygenase small subunit
VALRTESPAISLPAETYYEIQDFYARQMQLLDEGRTEEWASTFTEDGVFDASAAPEPVRSRAAIAAGASAASAGFTAQGIQRRHWLGMISAAPRADGTVSAQCYALVITTPKGGRPAIGASTTCNDILVRESDDWKVQERKVVRDDLS